MHKHDSTEANNFNPKVKKEVIQVMPIPISLSSYQGQTYSKTKANHGIAQSHQCMFKHSNT